MAKKGKISFVNLVTIISGLIVIFFAIPQLRDLFSSDHTKYKKSNFREGDLNFPLKTPPAFHVPENPPLFSTKEIVDRYPKIRGILIKKIDSLITMNIGLGKTLVFVPPPKLYRGIEIQVQLHIVCGTSKIAFAVKDSRLYVSVEFKDLLSGQTIGSIEYNHWSLYIPNLYDYHDSDSSLEVIDHQHNVVFSVKYQCKRTKQFLIPFLTVSGYFVNPSSVLVVPNDTSASSEDSYCFSKDSANWQRNAMIEIEKIKHTF